jgi:hypothetical protein
VVEARSERVVIGMDPHKRSVTIEVMAADEQVLGGGRTPAGGSLPRDRPQTGPKALTHPA